MKRIIRALVSAIGLFLIVFGVPILLFNIGILTGLDRLASLTGPDDGMLFLGVLTLVAWVAWVIVTVTIILEIINVITRGRIVWQLPGTQWFRPGVAALVVTASSFIIAPLIQPSMMAGAAEAPEASQPPPTSVAATTVSVNEKSVVAEKVERYHVKSGDDLWTLAEHFYGDGSKWREIADANTWLEPAQELNPDMILILPDLPKVSETDQIPTSQTEVDKATDILKEVSNKSTISNSASSHSAASSEVKKTTISNDNQIDAAESISAKSTPVKSIPAKVTIKRGDTLWRLAKVYLGDPERWPEIYRLNTDKISDPDEIDIGWVLTMPSVSTNETADQAKKLLKPVNTVTETKKSEASPEKVVSVQSQDSTTESKIDLPANKAKVNTDKSAPVVKPTQSPTVSSESQQHTTNPLLAAKSKSISENNNQILGQSHEIATNSGSIHTGAVAAIGATLAFGVLGVLGKQRLRQLLIRGLGRRIPIAGGEASRLEQALALRTNNPEDVPENPKMTQVVLGWRNSGTAMLTELEANRITSLIGNRDVVAGAVAMVSSSLACASWSNEVEQRLIGRHECWAEQLDDPAVASHTLNEGLESLNSLVDARIKALTGRDIEQLRKDPDTAPSWVPVVFIFCDSLPAEDLNVVAHLPAGLGISVVLASPIKPIGVSVKYSGEQAELNGESFTAQLLGAPARRALIELFISVGSTDTTAAPWWSSGDELPHNVTCLMRHNEREELTMSDGSLEAYSHPTLLLLGPVQLVGTTGTPPTRSVKQCEEYCAWLLENPGATPTRMSDALMVAEATRRSTMSRLRSWLGATPNGDMYLPDAYSGRIELHPDVASDWEQFQVIISGGVNRVSSTALQQALKLVRGKPLADASPWQWVWATQLRTDMVSAIRDAGAVLATQALELNDGELARWALARAMEAVPDDELLIATLIDVENRFGSFDEVKRLVLRLTRQSKETGIDLSEQTVSVLQRVMDGHHRAHTL